MSAFTSLTFLKAAAKDEEKEDDSSEEEEDNDDDNLDLQVDAETGRVLLPSRCDLSLNRLKEIIRDFVTSAYRKSHFFSIQLYCIPDPVFNEALSHQISRRRSLGLPLPTIQLIILTMANSRMPSYCVSHPSCGLTKSQLCGTFGKVARKQVGQGLCSMALCQRILAFVRLHPG